MRQNKRRGYFAFVRAQMVEVVTSQAQHNADRHNMLRFSFMAKPIGYFTQCRQKH